MKIVLLVSPSAKDRVPGVSVKSAEVAVDYLFSGRLRNCVNGLDRPGALRR